MGNFQLSSHPKNTNDPFPNGLILVICKIDQHVVSSAGESETVGAFYKCLLAISIRNMLEALNHRQRENTVKIYNSMTNGFVHNNMLQKRSKSWGMRYH